MKLLQGFNFGIKEIDLSNNRLGEDKSYQCIEFLSGIIKDRRYLGIEILILDDNRINDAQATMLFEALIITSYKTLRVLSLG